MSDTALDTAPTVYESLNDAIAMLGYVAPDGTNTNQGFSFRSIDGVVGAVRTVLVNHGLTIIPSFESLEQIDYRKDDGRISHRAILLGTFTVVGPSGDTFSFTTIGEAMDTEGRASNKAMSAATKNAYLRLFQIGAGSDDGDGTDAVPHAAPARTAPPAPSSLGDRIATAAGAAPAQAPVAKAQGGTDSGELLSVGQGKNLYRLWKHVLNWDKDRFLQEVEVVTGTYIADDRQLTKRQASDLIRALKIRAGEPVDDGPPPAQAPPVESDDFEDF